MEHRLIMLLSQFKALGDILLIVEIADRLHFSETASFTRFFTRMKGMTPREFRKVK